MHERLRDAVRPPPAREGQRDGASAEAAASDPSANAAAIMAGLKARVAEIAQWIPRGRPVIYFDYPVYLNVGDLWINWATEAFFADQGYDVVDRVSMHNFTKRTAEKITGDTVLVFQGGGNFGDLYPYLQEFRESVLSRFPDNQAFILPQTLYYRDPEQLQRASGRLARSANLHIFARDLTTLEYVRKHFAASVSPAPDMAHYLWGQFEPLRDGVMHDKPLYFIRYDHRGAAWPAELKVSPDRTVDWPSFVTRGEQRAFRLLRMLHEIDRKANHPLPVWRWWYYYRDRLISRSARLFASHSRVITNRLHGLVIGLLLGRPVTIGDTGYGKLTAYHETWLKGMPTVRLVGERIHLVKMRW